MAPTSIKVERSKSILKQLREERGFSQRALADKLKITRPTLQRIENKAADEISLGEIELFSAGIGLQVEEILQYIRQVETHDTLIRANLKKPAYTIEYCDGVKLACCEDNDENCFIGTFTLEPMAALPKEKAPISPMLFYLVLEGKLTVSYLTYDQVIQKGEYFSLRHHTRYEIYNPDRLKPLQALVFSMPSFLHT